MNKLSLIERFLFSNVSIMRNKGLSYGSFGTSLSMLCSGLYQEEEITRSLINTLTKSLCCVMAGSDNSFDTGKMGVGCGLLFLRINKILDSEFDNVFAASHQQIIDEMDYRQKMHQITDVSYILHCLIYSHLIGISNSTLSMPTPDSDTLFRSCEKIVSEHINRVTNYFQFEKLSIIIKEMLTYCKVTNLYRNSVCDLYKHFVSFGENAGYLIMDMDLLRLALNVIFPKSDSNEGILDGILKSVQNAAIDTCDYLHYVGLKSLVRSYNLISENGPLDVNNFGQEINDLTFFSECNPSTLMTLRGGYPRQYLYSSNLLKYTDVIIL